MDDNEKLRRFILSEVCPEAGLNDLSDDEPLISSGLVDSLGILKILSFLDDEFNINIASDEIKHDNFSTVGTICTLIEKNRNAG
ncbi:MAG: acyl carrier protein [Deltaproteobacteria bacterium]|nr:acyl carrier protein [Deltaproteobacteria bacterium]